MLPKAVMTNRRSERDSATAASHVFLNSTSPPQPDDARSQPFTQEGSNSDNEHVYQQRGSTAPELLGPHVGANLAATALRPCCEPRPMGGQVGITAARWVVERSCTGLTDMVIFL
jgi:hypothetical protein